LITPFHVGKAIGDLGNIPDTYDLLDLAYGNTVLLPNGKGHELEFIGFAPYTFENVFYKC
jgi:hypothetical protein